MLHKNFSININDNVKLLSFLIRARRKNDRIFILENSVSQIFLLRFFYDINI
jgi:hypothetical protein